MRNRAWIAAMVMAGAMCVVMVAAQAQQPQTQQPKLTHAQLTVKAGDLQHEIASAQTATWIGYSVPATHRINSDWDGAVFLEGETAQQHQARIDSQPIVPAVIMLRVTEGKIERIQIDGMDREIDAGGMPFVWLTGVSMPDSVKMLKGVVEASAAEAQKVAANPPAVVATGDRERDRIERDVQREPARRLERLQEHGLLAIAIEDCPEATAALKSFTAASYSATLRERAAFWLANERGAEGLKIIIELLKTETDEALRVKLVFDLTLVKGGAEKAAVDELISLAKTDAMPKVRTQAQFWLAQIAGKNGGDPRITVALSDAARNDPEAGIRKSAVFALSRLPVDQAVPELIQVASTTKDATTRKEAIFWLGQSKDPRALDYLVKVVKEQ